MLFLKLGTAIVMIKAPRAITIINSSNVKPDVFCLVDISCPFQFARFYSMKGIILVDRATDFALGHTCLIRAALTR